MNISKYIIVYLCFFNTLTADPNTDNQGLNITEKILTELDLPNWFWGGAHNFANIVNNLEQPEDELLNQYLYGFSTIATGLNDPLNVLNKEEQQIITKLISEHDMKSAFPLYINILNTGQQLPLIRAQIKPRLNHAFKNRNALVMFYHMNDPRNVDGYLCLDEKGVIENWEVDELYIKSARDASIHINSFDQLEHFVRDLSKRSYWLEQKLMPPVLADNSNNSDLSSKTHSHWNKWFTILSDHIIALSLAIFTILIGLWYFLWSRKWRKFVIPDQKTPLRFGAHHGANISNVIEFSDPRASLSEQYKKIKNNDL